MIVLVSLVYAGSINGAFVWDDHYLVESNAYIRSWSNMANIFSRNLSAGSGRHDTFYRPLQTLTYTLDFSFGKLAVQGYHITNIFLHAAAALSVFWLVTLIFGERLLSFFTAGLFAAHPGHTEAVAYISGRADPLAALFMLASFGLYIKYLDRPGRRYLASALALYLLALLSRESSFVLPLLFLLYHYVFKKKIDAIGLISFVGLTIVFGLWRFMVLGASIAHPEALGTPLARLPGFFTAITEYFRILIAPFDLHMEYGRKLFSFASAKTLTGAALFFGLAYYALKNRSKPVLCFGLLWFLGLLLPTSNVVYPMNAYMAEHWLYLPSIGFFLVLAAGLVYLYRFSAWRLAAVAMFGGLLCFYAFLTFAQNDYWRSPAAFYTRTLRFAPQSARLYVGLGYDYKRQGDIAKAAAYYAQAIKVDPSCAQAYYDLGLIQEGQGSLGQAEELYKQAISADSRLAEAYNRLARLYEKQGRPVLTVDLYRQAIAAGPNFIPAYNNLAIVYERAGQPDKALDLYRRALSINPSGEVYSNLGALYASQGQREKALSCFKAALRIEPEAAAVYNNLAVVYYSLKDYDLAVQYARQARNRGYAVDPGFLKLLESHERSR